jgi:hypothetical protein
MWIGQKPLPSAPGVEQIFRGYRIRDLVATPIELSRLGTVTLNIIIIIIIMKN